MNNNVNPIIGSVVKVINEYFKSLDDEIDLKLNDNIQIILDDEEYNDGWYYGRNLRTNNIGLFPKCFTVPLNETQTDLDKKENIDSIENNTNIENVNMEKLPESNNTSILSNTKADTTDNDDRIRKTSLNNTVYSGNDSHGSNISLSRNKNISGSRRILSPLALNSSQSSITTPKGNDIYSNNNGSVSRNFSRALSSNSIKTPTSPQDAQDEVLIKELINQSDVNKLSNPAKHVQNWEPKDVAVYFYNKKIELDSALKFYDHKIDGKILLALELQDLKNELDILSFGTRYSINKEIEYLKQVNLHGKDFDSDYDASSFSPSVRSSRRSSLLLPAATVRKNSLPQSTNDSVTLGNTSMDGSNSINNSRKPTTGITGDQNGQLTRNGTQNYRSISTNKTNLQTPTSQTFNSNPVLRRATSSSSNIKKVVNKDLPSELNFESPRKAPKPPPGPSPVSNSLTKSPDVGNFYNSPLQNSNNHGDRIYSNSSNNNSASNMLKKSTSFLHRNLSFKSGPSNNSSRNVTPNVNANMPTFQQPSLLKSNSSFNNNNNLMKTPQRGGLKESKLETEFNVTPKLGSNNQQYPILEQSLFVDNNGGFDSVNSPIYQQPRNVSQKRSQPFGANIDFSQPPVSNRLQSDSRKPSFASSASSNASFSKKTTAAYNHKKSESGGSFLDLFNRLDSIQVGSGKSTPTIKQQNQFMPPGSSYGENYSSASNYSKSGSFADRGSSNYMPSENGRPTSSIYVHSRTNTNGTNYVNAFGHSRKQSFVPGGATAGSLTENADTSFSSSTDDYNGNDTGFVGGEYVDFDQANSIEFKDSDIINKINNANVSISKPPTAASTNLVDNKNVSSSSLSSTSNNNGNSSSKLKKFQTSAFKEGINSIPCKESMKTASMHGWMGKKNTNGGIKGINTWKRRYFLLHGTRLSYYVSPDDNKERGLIDITGYSVVPCNMLSDNNTDKLITLFSSSMSNKNKYFFKIVPPKPGSKKGVNFTQQKIYYFAVENQEDTRAWMNSLLKATIDLDTSVPIISSCDTPTISLDQAKVMLENARKELLAREREKNQHLHLSNNTILIQSPQKQEQTNQENFDINDGENDHNDDDDNNNEFSDNNRELSLDPLKQ